MVGRKEIMGNVKNAKKSLLELHEKAYLIDLVIDGGLLK
jgi:hypothetical protein